MRNENSSRYHTEAYHYRRVYDRAYDQKYTFKVAKDANKIEIAKAIEEVFPGTKVAKVNTMNVRGHERRQGMNKGYTPSWKKAIVTLTEDSKEIEFFNDMM